KTTNTNHKTIGIERHRLIQINHGLHLNNKKRIYSQVKVPKHIFMITMNQQFQMHKRYRQMVKYIKSQMMINKKETQTSQTQDKELHNLKIQRTKKRYHKIKQRQMIHSL